MLWVASTLHTTSGHGVSSITTITTAEAHTDLNGHIRFAERRNLVSARVPSHFKRSLTQFFLLDFCRLSTGSFPGVKRPRRGDRHSPPFIFEVANGLQLYLCLYPVPAYPRYVVTCTLPLAGFTGAPVKINRIEGILSILSELFRTDLRVVGEDLALC